MILKSCYTPAEVDEAAVQACPGTGSAASLAPPREQALGGCSEGQCGQVVSTQTENQNQNGFSVDILKNTPCNEVSTSGVKNWKYYQCILNK